MHYSLVETLEQTSAVWLPIWMKHGNYFYRLPQSHRILPVYEQPKSGVPIVLQLSPYWQKPIYMLPAQKKQRTFVSRYETRRTQMYDSAAYFANEVITKQNTYGFEDNLLSIYDVENPRGKEKISSWEWIEKPDKPKEIF
jgi:hypothetical protein